MDTNITSMPKKAAPAPLNGVNTPLLFATISAVGAQPELAKFQFAASNRWVQGTHSQSVMHWFAGAGEPQQHRSAFRADADHPAVLCGNDAGPSPVEWVLHALACLGRLEDPMLDVMTRLRVPGRYAHVVSAFIMSTVICAITSGMITAINTGFDAGYVERWLRAYGLAWAFAFPTVALTSPGVRRLVDKITL